MEARLTPKTTPASNPIITPPEVSVTVPGVTQEVTQQNIPSYLTEPTTLDELRTQADQAERDAAEKTETYRKSKETYDVFMNSTTNVDDIDFLQLRVGYADQKEAERKALLQGMQRAEKAMEEADRAYRMIQAELNRRMRMQEYEQYLSLGQEALSAEVRRLKAGLDQTGVRREQLEQEYNAVLGLTGDSAPEMGSTSPERAAQAQSLLAQAQKLNKEYRQAEDTLYVLEDAYNQRTNWQQISQMSEIDFFLLELATKEKSPADRIKAINNATPQVRQQLREMGYTAILSSPKKQLKKQGYTNEEIERLCQAYERYLNNEAMVELQHTAAEAADGNPILTTITTYPAKVLGDVSSDITALAHNIGHDLGLTEYHTMDVNHPGFAASEYVSTVRDTVAQDLSGTGRALYEIGNDTVDNLFKDGVAEAVGMPWLGVTGAYGNTYREATLNGGTPEQSHFLGTANLGWALLQESADDQSSSMSMAGRVKEELIAETTEKQAGNIWKDIWKNQPEYARRVALLIQEGVPQEAAAEQVLYQMMLERIG